MNPTTTKCQNFISMGVVITVSLLALLFNACSAAPITTDPSKPSQREIDAVDNEFAEVSLEVSILILSSTRQKPTAYPQNMGKHFFTPCDTMTV